MDRKRSLWVEEAALLAVALAARVAYALSIRTGPLFDHPLVDGRLFWEEAVRIASGGGAEPVFYKPPLFSHLLAAFLRLTGGGPGVARWALLLLSAAAAPLAARLARPITGRTGAIAAGLFTALYAPALFYGAEILPASTILVVNLFLLLLLCRAEERGGRASFGAAGLLLGISALARPTILLFLPYLLLRYRHRAAALLPLLAGSAVALAPALLHNAAAGDFVPVSSNGGINFYFGNHEGADGRSAIAPDLPNEPGEARRAAAAIARRERGRPLRPSEVSRYWYGRSLRWIATHSADATRLWSLKAYATLNDREFSDNIDFHAVEEESVPLRAAPFRFGLLLALALPGAALLRRTPRGRLLIAYGIAVTLPMILFFTVGRFRLPLLPFLAVAGAAGLVRAGAAFARGPTPAARAALPIVLLLVFSRTAFFGIDEDRTWHYHYLCGDASFRTGRVREGLAFFQEAFRRNPHSALARNALGFLYAERGENLDRAEELVRGALAIDPARRRFYLDSLGRVLFRQGRWDEASALLEEAIPLFAPEEASSRAEALGHLADVREAEGRGGEADSLRDAAEKVGREGIEPSTY